MRRTCLTIDLLPHNVPPPGMPPGSNASVKQLCDCRCQLVPIDYGTQREVVFGHYFSLLSEIFAFLRCWFVVVPVLWLVTDTLRNNFSVKRVNLFIRHLAGCSISPLGELDTAAA